MGKLKLFPSLMNVSTVLLAGCLPETNVVDIRDPLDFFRSLELRQNSGSAVT